MYQIICEKCTKGGKRKTVYFWTNNISNNNNILQITTVTGDKIKKIKYNEIIKIKKYKADMETYLCNVDINSFK